MMSQHGLNPHQTFRRIVTLCASLLAVLPLSCGAASTDISDVPMAIKNAAKPNLMFILDNSGSMEWRSVTGTDGLSQYGSSNVDF